MVTIGMNYEVLEEKEAVFERAFNRVLELMLEMEGHGESRLYRDVNARRSYLIVSEWTDQDAFDRFIRSEQFAKVTTWGKEQVLAGPPSHQVYGTSSGF